MHAESRRTWGQFLHQCKVVLEVYFRRPLTWGFLAGGVLYVLIFVGGFGTHITKQQRSLPIAARHFYSYEQPQGAEVQDFSLFLKREPAEQIRSLRMNSFEMHFDLHQPQLPAELSEMVNLNALALWGFGNSISDPRIQATGFVKISELEKLKSIKELVHVHLLGCQFEPGAVEFLGKQHQIKRLIIDQSSLGANVAELESFQALEHLELEKVSLTPELITTLLKLPKLKIVTLKEEQNFTKIEPDLLRLKAHPRLTWIFTDWRLHGLETEQALK